ncbi:hypothetical protein HWV62_9925 [Athelia sp. TMB]|nr:hypothetical protein HWV62_9925 [Athelia sp. TMB]
MRNTPPAGAPWNEGETHLGLDDDDNDVFRASSIETVNGIKRSFDSAGISSDDTGDNAGDGLDSLSTKANSPPPSKSKTRATQRSLSSTRRRTIEVAKTHLHAMISSREPFATGVAADALLVDSWLAGYREVAKDLRLPDDLLPEESELAILRQAVSLYRSTVRIVAQSKVPAYGFEKGSGDKTPVDIINKNKALYVVLTAKTYAWGYTDPHNTKTPGTMLCHPIVQSMINEVLFSDGENSLAYKGAGDYFNLDDEGLSFVTITFILTAVQWTAFISMYKKFLKKLEGWHRYTTMDSKSCAAEKFRREVWAAGREYSGVTVLAANDGEESSDSDFAADEA